MSMSYSDYAYEEAIADLYKSALKKREKLIQCIYLFVEGKSELLAIPRLLELANYSLEDNAVEIVDIGGAANSKHVVNVLRRTISRERPLVLVLDLDEAGINAANHPLIRNDDLTSVVHMPKDPAVEYTNGLRGGTFEDSFDIETLIDATLKTLSSDLRETLSLKSILTNIDIEKPRLNQISRELRVTIPGFNEVDKISLAGQLAEISKAPLSILNLAQHLTSIREEHPLLDQAEEVDKFMDELE